MDEKLFISLVYVQCLNALEYAIVLQRHKILKLNTVLANALDD